MLNNLQSTVLSQDPLSTYYHNFKWARNQVMNVKPVIIGYTNKKKLNFTFLLLLIMKLKYEIMHLPVLEKTIE